MCGENAHPACHSVLWAGSSPRVRGKLCGLVGHLTLWGSSPRVRGKPVSTAHAAGAGGLIPACAGKTCISPVLLAAPRAHPRVCGENRLEEFAVTPAPGSSPRVRGKHRYRLKLAIHGGLIPACAGKTF